MTINIRSKGATAEREICDMCNYITGKVMAEMGFPKPKEPLFQRNQNQTAVGGSDIANPFGLSMEVKRQEQLSINTWWKQCTDAANRFHEVPVLLYRQSCKDWRCVMLAELPLPAVNGSVGTAMQARVEISEQDFRTWFEQFVRRKLVQDGLRV